MTRRRQAGRSRLAPTSSSSSALNWAQRRQWPEWVTNDTHVEDAGNEAWRSSMRHVCRLPQRSRFTLGYCWRRTRAYQALKLGLATRDPGLDRANGDRHQRFNEGQFEIDVLDLVVWEPLLLAEHPEKLPVQCREQPGLHLRDVPELMAFCGPKVERLLSHIGGVRCGVREAEGELVQGLIVSPHYILKPRLA